MEAFVPSATPSRGDIDVDQVYPTESAYLYALADAMHEEYKAIVDAGFVVQLDLGLPARNQVLPGKTDASWADLRRASEMQIEAYNHALRGIPEDRVRYHLCWEQHEYPAHHRRAAEGHYRLKFFVSTRRPIPSRRPTRATSTNGQFGKMSNFRTEKS